MVGIVVGAGVVVFTRVAGAVTSPDGAAGIEATFAAASPVAFGLAFVLALAAAFVGGVLVVDAAVGAVFAAGGAAAIDWLEARLAIWFLLMFLVLAVLAVVTLGVWRPSLSSFAPDLPRPDTVGGAFPAGVPFGLLACPSCTPMLLPVILGAVATGDPVYGAAVLGTFGLGRGLPLVAVGASAGAARAARSLRRYVPVVERTVGFLLAAGALYFLWAFGLTVADRGLA